MEMMADSKPIEIQYKDSHLPQLPPRTLQKILDILGQDLKISHIARLTIRRCSWIDVLRMSRSFWFNHFYFKCFACKSRMMIVDVRLRIGLSGKINLFTFASELQYCPDCNDIRSHCRLYPSSDLS